MGGGEVWLWYKQSCDISSVTEFVATCSTLYSCGSPWLISTEEINPFLNACNPQSARSIDQYLNIVIWMILWFGTFVNFFRFNRTSKIGATTMGENGMVLNGSVMSVLTHKVGSSILQTEGCGLGLKKSKTCMFCILQKIYFRGEKTLPTPGYPLNQFVYYTHPVPSEQVLVHANR